MDMDAFMTLALEKGLFAALFVFAFIFILKENKKREESQRGLFLDLSDSLEKAKDAILIIENKLERVDNNTTNLTQDFLEIKYMINSMETILKNNIRGQNNRK